MKKNCFKEKWDQDFLQEISLIPEELTKNEQKEFEIEPEIIDTLKSHNITRGKIGDSVHSFPDATCINVCNTETEITL